MNIYRITNLNENAPEFTFYRTRDEMVEAARANSLQRRQPLSYDLQLLDIPTSSAELVALLNTSIGDWPTTRNWILTSRGGLKEVEP